jgi:predicted nucleic acid-binding protein
MNAFVDTNLLLYAAENDDTAGQKTAIARELLLQPGLHISVQVLNEFIVNARSPRKLALTAAGEADWIEKLLLYPVMSLTDRTFIRALELHQRYQTSHWDSLIIASALECQCEVLYSEDLNQGQDYGGVRVMNPFFDSE